MVDYENALESLVSNLSEETKQEQAETIKTLVRAVKLAERWENEIVGGVLFKKSKGKK